MPVPRRAPTRAELLRDLERSLAVHLDTMSDLSVPIRVRVQAWRAANRVLVTLQRAGRLGRRVMWLPR